MRVLLSWFCEYEDGTTERAAKVCESKEVAEKYIEENLKDDDSVLDYDIYVPIKHYNWAVEDNKELKKKVTKVISELVKFI